MPFVAPRVGGVVIANIAEVAGDTGAKSVRAENRDAIYLNDAAASENSCVSAIECTVAQDGKLTTLENNAGINRMPASTKRCWKIGS